MLLPEANMGRTKTDQKSSTELPFRTFLENIEVLVENSPQSDNDKKMNTTPKDNEPTYESTQPIDDVANT